MLPHRSGSHAMLNGRLKLFWLPGPPALAAGSAVTTGSNAARATLTAALACRYCASASSTFWFETPTCSSSAFRAASLYNSHHRPFEYASPGCDCFHPAASASLKFMGGCSLRSEEHTSELQSL